jgi:succinate dehydrogenase/fumarate reductase flavoprotein subunit
MKPDKLIVGPNEFKVYRLNTVVVGSGAAGLNAADCLYDLGVRDIAIVTEGMNRGTSRNTGSDKQTYYKISTGGDVPDSPVEMAKDLVKGGAMHGDIALTEAACSFRCFSKLIDLGVPFPHNEYGEYVGYKTDHDPKARATSAGPLTSRYMTEALERSVRLKNIPVIDNVLITGIITTGEEEKECIGLVGVDLTVSEGISEQLVLFNCTNVIFATGGPAGMYRDSVYPESQVGSNGIAFEAGVRGMNVIESQYGIASVKFRWNLSGSYQQVIPRYVSTDREGNDPTEFLTPYFDSPGKLLTAVFLKGYQWPFDPRKIKGQKSSFIDLLVYNEIYNKGRRVFLDYTKNPLCSLKDGAFDFSLLEEEAYTYMANCDILFGTPIERLIKMNKPAYELYLSHGFDLKKDWLEISVCAQHNNGGLFANNRWESNIKHFFPVGECAGTFGIYRPGGSALNNTQVSSLRAAEYIAAKYNNPPRDNRNPHTLIARIPIVFAGTAAHPAASMVNVPFALGIGGERRQECQQQGQHKKNTKVSFHNASFKSKNAAFSLRFVYIFSYQLVHVSNLVAILIHIICRCTRASCFGYPTEAGEINFAVFFLTALRLIGLRGI